MMMGKVGAGIATTRAGAALGSAAESFLSRGSKSGALLLLGVGPARKGMGAFNLRGSSFCPPAGDKAYADTYPVNSEKP